MSALPTFGPWSWSKSQDDLGHRTYKVRYLVTCTSPFDGPSVALTSPGLPLVGAFWIIDNDRDFYAWCRWNHEITPLVTGEPNTKFYIDYEFSTKPMNRCTLFPVEDPLLEPMKISGSFTKYQQEATTDRFGRPNLNSSHELIRGPQVEFDSNRPTVKIEQNVLSLQLNLFSSMVDTVNSDVMWGVPARCIKLSNVTWERKYYGECNTYYTRTFEFDIRYDTFDRVLLDEGSKVLSGHWGNPNNPADAGNAGWITDKIANDGSLPDPNPGNPSHYIQYKDRQGENAKTVLDGSGRPYYPPPIQGTTACSQCPNGAPFHFVVQGVKQQPLIVDTAEDAANPYYPLVTYILDHTSGCNWSGTGFDLTYIPAVKAWQLTGLSQIWFCRARDFNPWGQGSIFKIPNQVASQPLIPAGNPPGSVLLIGQYKTSNAPGSIGIQKYSESNFFQLGLPVTLDESEAPAYQPMDPYSSLLVALTVN